MASEVQLQINHSITINHCRISQSSGLMRLFIRIYEFNESSILQLYLESTMGHLGVGHKLEMMQGWVIEKNLRVPM